MSAAFTIILPHKRNPGNDRSLKVCLDCLMENTVHDFILIMDAATNQPLYERVNNMVEQATTEICVYWASDIYAARRWDVPMLETYTPTTFVTNILVEPGVQGIHADNHLHDFGRKPETFERAAFEQWAAQPNAPIPDGEGFPAPYLFNRYLWLDFGGLDPSQGAEFTPVDMQLFDRWKAAGNKVKRARSYCYHLQRYSDLNWQLQPNRSEHS